MSRSSVTIHDIAKSLGVSTSTVSRALQAHPRISERTRLKVVKKAAELNYRPNQMAAALRSGRTRLIGVVVPQANRAFFANIINGVEEAAAAQGFRVLVMQHHNDSTQEADHVAALRHLQVDRMVICPADDGAMDQELYHQLKGEGVKLQFVDRRVRGLSGPYVTLNDFEGGYLATQHLIERGYRRIAHLSRSREQLIYRDRERGYREALADAGLRVDEGLVLYVLSQVEAGHTAYEQLFASEIAPPDAVFSSSDFAALGLLQAAQKGGKSIPEDLGIVGFANEPFTAYVTPSLTTVEQQPTEMGRLAANRLMDLDNTFTTEATNVQTIVFSPKLIIRQSSSRPTPKA